MTMISMASVADESHVGTHHAMAGNDGIEGIGRHDPANPPGDGAGYGGDVAV